MICRESISFSAGCGTTGSTRGAGEALLEKNAMLKNIGIVSSKNGFIPGIRNSDEMYEVGLFEKNFYDQIVEITMDEALDGMITLIRKCGVLSGPTGGSSLAGALKYLSSVDQTLTEKHNAVFLVCDRVEWYLSFLQKLRPQWFGLTVRDSGYQALTAEQIDEAAEITADEAQSPVGPGRKIDSGGCARRTGFQRFAH
jgi:hypothetical protein